MHDPWIPAEPGYHLELRSPISMKLLSGFDWWVMSRRAIESWTNSSGFLSFFFLFSTCSVALWRPAESSPVGFAGQYVLRICNLDPVVSMVTDIARPSPVVSLQSPSIFGLSAALTMTTCPPTVQFVCSLIDEATKVSDPSSVLIW